MRKILLTLLLSTFSFVANSQIMYHTGQELDSTKSVYFTMYKLVSVYHPFGLKTYLFGIDFFGFKGDIDAQKLHLITTDGKSISLKENKKLSEKETIYFQIWRRRINPDKIDLVIYQDKSGNYYQFKMKNE